jgi:FAD/FMN-containing dehydrogenase
VASQGGADSLTLAEGFKGQAIRPGQPGYDEARAVINGSIDKRPALVVQPRGAADVIDAVNLARDAGLPLGVKCGGHSVAGNGTVEGGILVDLSSLKGVRVDPAARTARANGGVLVGEFDRETQLFGLAAPLGRVTTTGIGGFTLGGGYGWLSPKYGLACDNLISADVVTADGRLVTASESENADLFWGIRGGSSNFGVVTSFEFRLHPVGPMVLAGLIAHPLDGRAGDLVRGYRDYVESAPEELVTALAVVLAPPAPFVPEWAIGKPTLAMIAFYVGDPEAGKPVVAPLKALGKPVADIVQPMPYTAFQAMLDGFSPNGLMNYHRGIHLRGSLSDAAIDAYIGATTEIAQVMSPLTQLILFRHGGAVSRVPDDAMAAGNRDATYMAHPIAIWPDPSQAKIHLDAVRRFSDAMAPFATGGVYLNFEPDEGEQKVRAGYGNAKYERLVALKEKWDPENLFRVNQNVRPRRASEMRAAA